MSELFPIYTIDIADSRQIEQMGSKEKFWFEETNTRNMWLFKYCRYGAGEDWSEKIAAEIAGILGLPHAVVELAVCQERRGVMSKDFTERRTRGHLVHGNELLTCKDPNYPGQRRYRVSQHTVKTIYDVLSEEFIHLSEDFSYPPGITVPVDLFVGYLMLDALTGNTDRHHENWGILVQLDKSADKLCAYLSPSFDHASSLGRELREEKRVLSADFYVLTERGCWTCENVSNE